MEKTIKTAFGDYQLALITPDFTFWVNYSESDENAQVIMKNKQGELISDNYFALVGLQQAIEEKQYTWKRNTHRGRLIQQDKSNKNGY